MSFESESLSNILENQPTDSIIGNGRDFSIVAAQDPKDGDADPHGSKGDMMNPAQFMETLHRQFGSPEEFHQFERLYYVQKEEVAILYDNFETYKSKASKILDDIDEHRKLDLEEQRASREEDFKNAKTDQYEATSERKAEAFKESAEAKCLREQCSILLPQLAEALRKLNEYAKKKDEMDQYRACIEAYGKPQEETIKDIQSQVADPERVKDSLDEISERAENEVKNAVPLDTALQRMRFISSKQEDLNNALIIFFGELVQSQGHSERLPSMVQKAQEMSEQLTQLTAEYGK